LDERSGEEFNRPQGKRGYTRGRLGKKKKKKVGPIEEKKRETEGSRAKQYRLRAKGRRAGGGTRKKSGGGGGWKDPL